MLSKYPTLRALGFWVDVHAFVRLPDTRQTTQGSEIGQAIGNTLSGSVKMSAGMGSIRKPG